MKIQETIDDFEFQQLLNEEKFSDERLKSILGKIEKGIDVGRDGKYTKIGKIEGEARSTNVQGAKKSYAEIADQANEIRKGLLSGAYSGSSKKEKNQNVPHKLNQLRNLLKKMKFHKKMLEKYSDESSKKEYEADLEKKLRKPIRDKFAFEEKVKKAEKKMVKGAKTKRKADWENRVKENLNKNYRMANF